MTIARPSHLLFLTLESAADDPWSPAGLVLPSEIVVSKRALTLHPEFVVPLESGVNPVSHIVVDLDSIARTRGLDQWAVASWKATLNEWVVLNIVPQQPAPEVNAFCRLPSWDMARLGAQLGARDLLGPQDLAAKFGQSEESASVQPPLPKQLFSFAELRMQLKGKISDEPVAEVVVAAPTPPSENFDTLPVEIPRHAIPFPIDGLDGSSPAIETVRQLIRRTAPLDTPVLIRGATGSGKELIARTLHRYSPRASGAFIAVNCGAISAELVESELFGHIKGSFTDAIADKKGFLQSADGGTLFLDELTELTPEIQVKLLRALQERVITPVGSQTPLAVDFRLVSATKDDIEEEVREGSFREDLYYRLKVIEISLPALGERRADLADIARSTLKRLARKHRRAVLEMSDATFEKFLLYDWPGNIRELENVIERAATLAWAENRLVIELTDLPEEIRFSTMSNGNTQHLKEIVKRFEKEYIASTIRRLGGSKEEAADSLGLSLATLYRKIGA